MENIFNEFVKQKFIIPFGRVIHGGLLKSPYNETMVGRKKQRKYFIRWLLEPKKNGSLLVTGTRGSGKSSFVNHCIAEHNLNLYSRIVQNNISPKVGDLFILVLIFLFLAVILEFCLSFLFIKSESFLTKSIFIFIGGLPFLMTLLYGWMLFSALKSINSQYEKTLKGFEDTLFAKKINSLATWLKIKSILFILVPINILIICVIPKLNNKIEVVNTIILFVIIAHVLSLVCLYFIHEMNKGVKNINFIIYSISALILVGMIVITILSYINYDFSDYTIGSYIILLFFFYMLIGYCLEKRITYDLLEQKDDSLDIEKQKRYANHLTQWSFPVIILRHYIPSIHITINLGFKDLKHSNIIHAMLIDLKNKYKQIFLGRDYAFNKIIPLLLVFSSLLIWKATPYELNASSGTDDKLNSTYQVVDISFMSIKNQSVKNSNSKSSFIEFLNNSVIEGKIDKNRVFVTGVLKGSEGNDGYYHFEYKLFDLIGLLLVFLLSYLIVILKPLSYHRRNLAKIDKLLRDFSSSVTRTQKGTVGSLHKMASSVIGNNERSTHSEPINSRIAEIRMIQLLDDIRKDQKSWFLSPGKIFTLASPSIIFVFDELDKLHNYNSLVDHLDFHDKRKSYTENEAARINQINTLLSDMKNFITTAKAKFIFVAGRDLHDQWLADSNSREAFLTSIFDMELFIPSLLTDHESKLADIKANIIKYVNLQYQRATYDSNNYNYNFNKQNTDNNLISEKDPDQFSETFSLISEGDQYSYFNTLYDKLTIFKDQQTDDVNKIGYVKNVNLFKMSDTDNQRFIYDLIQYLTYRSQGNPKQLRRIFYDFVRPTIVKNNEETTSDDYECVDALVFGDNEILRIQFLAGVFYNINLKVGNYITQTDDKMASSIFYLSDFIMKFHDHAFSWRHLYRLDELAHIHRLPGLHRVFQAIIRQFTGLYLHKVLNGVFVFRFRSDVSKELTYLSKVSDNDSAAYNFTLDESGDLKKIYKRKLLGDEPNNLDLITGLGELYDLDKEFDAARSEYIRAIDILDNNYNMRHSQELDKPLGEVLSNGFNALKANINWGSERLTLMLMIGMTYERDNRPNTALSHYRDARSLARKLVSTYSGVINENNTLGNSLNDERSFSEMLKVCSGFSEGVSSNNVTRFNVLKYFSILYQPLFAEAWLIEKAPGGLDSGLGILEKGIGQLRSILPFIKNMQGNIAVAPSNYGYSSFALIASHLHNKTGDLAFFKGNQNDKDKDKDKDEKMHGYLMRATYHYGVALHEIRRFISYRNITSGVKFNPVKGNYKCISVFDKPDYIVLALSSSLMDISESTLAKINIRKFSITDSTDYSLSDNVITSRKFFFERVDLWLGQRSCESNQNNEELLIKVFEGTCIKCGKLSDWFGKWRLGDNKKYDRYKQKIKGREKYYPDVLKYTQENSDFQRFIFGIHISWVGIYYLEKAGYFESASKEYFELSNSISTILWWLTTLNTNGNNNRPLPKKYFEYIVDFSISCLKRARTVAIKNKHGRLAPHKIKEVKGANYFDSVVNPEFITSAYSLYLLCLENKAYEQCNKVKKILCKWGGHTYEDFTFNLFEYMKGKPIIGITNIIKILTSEVDRSIGDVLMGKISIIVDIELKRRISRVIRQELKNNIYSVIDRKVKSVIVASFLKTFKEIDFDEFVNNNDENRIKQAVKNVLAKSLKEVTSEHFNTKFFINLKGVLNNIHPNLTCLKPHRVIEKLEDCIFELLNNKFNSFIAENGISSHEFEFYNNFINKDIKIKLKEHLLFSRYPILNRLRGLSVLIYCTYLNDGENCKDELQELTSALHYYNNLYDSPFHFSHMESGLCAYLTYNVIKNSNNRDDTGDKYWYKNIARKHLSKSISIHTMGKTFYEKITGLYYLYDDFNDRRIHMSHAMQMLGTSYAQFILDEIDGG